ncbi:MAG: Gx transporter family protein [Clostridiales bacterium]|nr:Gx transporter family protein [Clostridiales bacterium]
MKTSYKITLCAILCSLAVISFIIENLFPPFVLPGARMGVSNIFILLSAMILGWKYSIATLVVKVLLGSLFSGNFSAVMYSLPAGLIALAIELILIYATKRVSIVCVSVAGAVINVTVQNVIFCLITDTPEYLSYLPYLALTSIFAGLTIGFATYLILRKVKKLNANKT